MLNSLVIISMRWFSVLTLLIRQANLHWPNAEVLKLCGSMKGGGKIRKRKTNVFCWSEILEDDSCISFYQNVFSLAFLVSKHVPSPKSMKMFVPYNLC